MKYFLSLLMLACFVSASSAQNQPSFQEVTGITQTVTKAYFNAYFSLDFKAAEKLMHDEISFEDPTAKMIFGGAIKTGRDSVMHYFSTAYAGINSMNYELKREIFSGNTALFDLELTWGFYSDQKKKDLEFTIPLIIILTVKDGKVIQHRDYGDYRVFMKQYAEQ